MNNRLLIKADTVRIFYPEINQESIVEKKIFPSVRYRVKKLASITIDSYTYELWAAFQCPCLAEVLFPGQAQKADLLTSSMDTRRLDPYKKNPIIRREMVISYYALFQYQFGVSALFSIDKTIEE